MDVPRSPHDAANDTTANDAAAINSAAVDTGAGNSGVGNTAGAVVDEEAEDAADLEELAHEVAVHKVPWWGPGALAAFVGLVICSNVASGVWARWVNSHPEGLLMLSSRNRYLALCLTSGVKLVPYAVIGFVRLAAAFVVCHLLGRAYHDRVLYWFRRYLGVSKKQLDQMQDGFEKGQLILIPLLVGSNLVAALSGVHRTSARKLMSLLSIGIAGRLVLMWWLARRYESELLSFLKTLQKYQWPLLIGSIVLVVFANVRNFRRGAGA